MIRCIKQIASFISILVYFFSQFTLVFVVMNCHFSRCLYLKRERERERERDRDRYYIKRISLQEHAPF